MASVRFEEVTKSFGKVVAVRDFTLEIHDGEFLVLVGPSGWGKTTILRLVAGLEQVTSGEIYIAGKPVTMVPPGERDIAMVFQNYALYPHMDVFKNMAFCLEMRRVPKEEIKRRVYKAAEMLGIADLLNRKPRELSGGQRQRVALGRAIVREPKVFLFDEPLSNLDAKLRTAMRAELLDLHRRLRTTTIYVTHDQLEAMTMGSRIVVLNQGTIQQVDSPQNIYEKPVNLFVAGFIGSPFMNFLHCKIVHNEGVLWAHSPHFKLKIPRSKEPFLSPYLDREVVLGLRPEHIYHSESIKSSEAGTTFNGQIWVVERLGSEKLVHIRMGQVTITARVESNVDLKAGEVAEFKAAMTLSHVFDKETGRAIC
jgi:multiple sugar transport system ATP-binding protein